MVFLSPELWHIVASHLSIHDATQLRLVNRFFADIAGAYIIPDVSFHLHQDDIARLRGIASNGVLATNVKSLTYFTEGYKSPAGTFDEFKKYHEQTLLAKKLNSWRASASEEVERADDATLLSEYENYKHLVDVQDQLKADMADLLCLKDALAKFTGLRHVTMSSGNQFLDKPGGETPSPFKTPFELPTNWSRPEGVRQLEVLLEALAHNEIKLESLRTGTLEWVFFDKTSTELSRLFQPTFDAVHVEFEIALDLDDNLHDLNGDTEKCRRFMGRGLVRDLLSRMQRLELLRVGFLCDLNLPDDKPAMLRDIMSPNHHWPRLQQLELSGIGADRHSLMQLLNLHKDTLRFLCLQEVNLGETSWKKLLPEIRNNLYLEDACICGSMVGQEEDMPDKGLPERWNLSVPGIWENDMRASINCYCRKGGQDYPNELPLTDEVVEKYFDQYVRCHVKMSEAEDWEEQHRLETKTRREWRQAGLIPRRDDEDSEDSEDNESGWDSYDSDEQDEEDEEDEEDSYDEMEGINEGLDVDDLGYLDEPYDEEEDVEEVYAELRLQGFSRGSEGSDVGDDGAE